MNDLYLRAITLATKAHDGQKRWDGSPYINHPVAVAESVDTILEKILAVLHDVIEDGSPEIVTEFKNTFPSWVYDGVSLLSKQPGDDYFTFIMRLIKRGYVEVINVKIADITHNLSDLKKGAMRDKYLLARHLLKQSLVIKQLERLNG